MHLFNPCYPPGFFPNSHITLNLLPVYRYGHPLSIDTKISTNHSSMTSLWRHNVSTPTNIEKWTFCV